MLLLTSKDRLLATYPPRFIREIPGFPQAAECSDNICQNGDQARWSGAIRIARFLGLDQATQ
jgi:hypothetical protein